MVLNVYTQKSTILFALAELLSVAIICWMAGACITTQWNTALFYSQLVKKLYRVKSLSSGRVDERIDSLD